MPRLTKYDRQRKQQAKQIKKEMARAAHISAALTILLDGAFRQRDRAVVFHGARLDLRVWGDRAIDALSRARRALDEARRYGRR